MTDPLTLLQTAADTAAAADSLAASLSTLIPTICYGITAAAAFFPKPDDSAPTLIKWLYKAVNYIAFNFKHARNIAGDRRDAEPTEQDTPQ